MIEKRNIISEAGEFHVVTVGWSHGLVEQLANAIAARSSHGFSHITHPKYTLENWPQRPPQAGVHFFRDRLEQPMPQADRQLLASLERNDVPSLHNMILGDRVVSKLAYDDALEYATFLARRLIELFDEIKPTAIIVGFDAIHGSLALAVAKHMSIPVYALNFSVIPAGLACFCDGMSPAARVTMRDRPSSALLSLAKESLRRFENRETEAHAYIAPLPLPLSGKMAQLPARLRASYRTIRDSRKREFIKFTENRNSFSVLSALQHYRRTVAARKAVSAVKTIAEPPDTPFVIFGLHMQPESSIDVWAPFFSNQQWVIELLSRSIPPTHTLLIKIHKSDIANYPQAQLKQMCAFPGVQLVAPSADTRSFIERADLLIAIQGTMGLEAALIGKPVIMLGDSPVTIFPSASGVGALRDLPSLVRKKLTESPPSRNEIVDAYTEYLAPFFPASDNNWGEKKSTEQISGYVDMFNTLKSYVESLAEMSSHDNSAKAEG